LIIDDERYKGTQVFCRLLTNPNKKKIDPETYNTCWTKKGNFTEKDLSLYKTSLRKHTPSIKIMIRQQKSLSLVVVKME